MYHILRIKNLTQGQWSDKYGYKDVVNIDFHCYLDLYDDPMSLVESADKKNIFTLVVTTSPKAWMVTSRKFACYKNIEVAIGMHPEIVGKKINEREALIKNIANVDFVGEVGIDG